MMTIQKTLQKHLNRPKAKMITSTLHFHKRLLGKGKEKTKKGNSLASLYLTSNDKETRKVNRPSITITHFSKKESADRWNQRTQNCKSDRKSEMASIWTSQTFLDCVIKNHSFQYKKKHPAYKPKHPKLQIDQKGGNGRHLRKAKTKN